ncbi:MAG: hypothetical protein AAF471_09650, partial [Myxococcota bacterium]
RAEACSRMTRRCSHENYDEKCGVNIYSISISNQIFSCVQSVKVALLTDLRRYPRKGQKNRGANHTPRLARILKKAKREAAAGRAAAAVQAAVEGEVDGAAIQGRVNQAARRRTGHEKECRNEENECSQKKKGMKRRRDGWRKLTD